MRYTHGCSVLYRTTARTVTPPIIPVVKNDADFSNFDARFTNLVGVVSDTCDMACMFPLLTYFYQHGECGLWFSENGR